MGDVKRYSLYSSHVAGGTTFIESTEQLRKDFPQAVVYVRAGDFDAAQSELATMRREFEIGQQNWVDGMKTQKAAEQRNAELDLEWSRTITDRALITLERDRLKTFVEQISRQQGEPYFAQLAKAALKPTESGASE